MVYIGNYKAVQLWKKHSTTYDGGIVAVKTKDGQIHVFSTEQQTEFRVLIGGGENKCLIQFEDSTLGQDWKMILGYFFEPDSAMLFFGERSTVEQMGVYKVHGYGYETEEIQKMAYHVAAMLDSSLQDVIVHLESNVAQEGYELCYWID